MNNQTFTYQEKKLFGRFNMKINNNTGDRIIDDMISEKPLLYVKYTKSEQHIIRSAEHKITEKIHMIKKTLLAEIIKCDIIE